MSHIYNDQWIESAYESFSIALEEKDVRLAKDIIADTFDAGFDRAARGMNVMLREASSKWDTVTA